MTLKFRPTTSCGAALRKKKALSTPVDRLAVLPSLTVFYFTHSSRDEQGEANSCQILPCWLWNQTPLLWALLGTVWYRRVGTNIYPGAVPTLRPPVDSSHWLWAILAFLATAEWNHMAFPFFSLLFTLWNHPFTSTYTLLLMWPHNTLLCWWWAKRRNWPVAFLRGWVPSSLCLFSLYTLQLLKLYVPSTECGLLDCIFT